MKLNRLAKPASFIGESDLIRSRICQDVILSDLLISTGLLRYPHGIHTIPPVRCSPVTASANRTSYAPGLAHSRCSGEEYRKCCIAQTPFGVLAPLKHVCCSSRTDFQFRIGLCHSSGDTFVATPNLFDAEDLPYVELKLKLPCRRACRGTRTAFCLAHTRIVIKKRRSGSGGLDVAGIID